MTTHIQTNSCKAWFLAARPKTLTGALVPVAIALALAWHDLAAPNTLGTSGEAFSSPAFQLWPAVLCMLFACMMQIDANLVNDYYDCKRGIDAEDRLGPERACAQGWVTMSAMKKALVLVTTLSALIGLPLIWWDGWSMVLVGLACIIFCYLYTTLLSGKAMGDVLVLVFFGIIPVCITYYLQTGTVSAPCFWLSVGCGLATDNLLIVNNFRDINTDKLHGKITLVTLIGRQASLVLYLVLGITAAQLALHFTQPTHDVSVVPLCLYILLVLLNCRQLVKIGQGKALNAVLGKTALSILVYGIAVCIAILC